jgi:predicted double-glycine peptidase
VSQPFRLRAIRCLTAFALLSSTTASVSLAQIGIGQGLRVDRPARSLKALRDQNLVKQRFDFSWGAAALATILRFGFGEAVTEREILKQLFSLLSPDDKTTVQRTGFSLLHLQRVAQARGYTAQGFRLPPAQLSKLGGPVIVFIQPRGYEHFAVLRGVRDDRVYLADPSRGNVRMPGYAFLDDWVQDDGTGIIFVVEPQAGPPAGPSRLAITADGVTPPEILTARELLAIGPSLARLHGAAR